MFVSNNRQLGAVHLILDFQPLSDKFQDVGHMIRASDPQLTQIDVSVPGFLAREDIVPNKLPAYHFSCEAAVLREETATLRLSLEAKIDQFHLEEKGEEQGELVIQVSGSEDKPDRFLGVHTSDFIVVRIDNSSKEEEEEMVLNRKKGLWELLANRAKGLVPKDTSGSQPPSILPPTPHPPLLLLQSIHSLLPI